MVIVETGINRTRLLEETWSGLKSCEGGRPLELKTNRRKLVPFGTNVILEYIRRSKIKIKASAGAAFKIMACVIIGLDESLLGHRDAIKLRIVQFHPEGGEVVRSLKERKEKKGALEKSLGVFLGPFPHQVRKVTESVKKPRPGPEEIVSGGKRQEEIEAIMKEIRDKFKNLFVGLGRA